MRRKKGQEGEVRRDVGIKEINKGRRVDDQNGKKRKKKE